MCQICKMYIGVEHIFPLMYVFLVFNLGSSILLLQLVSPVLSLTTFFSRIFGYTFVYRILVSSKREETLMCQIFYGMATGRGKTLALHLIMTVICAMKKRDLKKQGEKEGRIRSNIFQTQHKFISEKKFVEMSQK